MSNIYAKDLTNFCVEVFKKNGFKQQEAQICADVLVSADLRGLSTHGVASLQRYIDGIEEKNILPQSKYKIISETPASIHLDACGMMGMITSDFVMKSIIHKAKKTGISIGTIRNSNHFGFGAFYAKQAVDVDMIGLVLSNTAAIAVPTDGLEAKIGTNPISFAAPCNQTSNFILDMSTTVVPRGMIKKYADEGKTMPEGWIVDEEGNYITNSLDAIKMLEAGTGRGGLLPLGGASALTGGHKGFGLAVMVDVLTGILSGFKPSCDIQDTEKAAGRSSHTFIVINIGIFRDINKFKQDMDEMLFNIQDSATLDNKQVIFHGKRETELENKQMIEGIDLLLSTVQSLEKISNKYDVELVIR